MATLMRALLNHEIDSISGGYAVQVAVDGNGDCNISGENITAPDGFSAQNLYSVEVDYDDITGTWTTSLTYDLDYDALTGASSPPPSEGGGRPTGDYLSPQGGQPPRTCTVTVSRSTTTVSRAGSVSINLGLLSGSTGSGTQSSTTTYSVAVEGMMVGNRCVAPKVTISKR